MEQTEELSYFQGIHACRLALSITLVTYLGLGVT